jgi:hypothetical protein
VRLKTGTDFLIFGGEILPPLPALAVVFGLLRFLLSGAGYTGKRYGKIGGSLCGRTLK